MSYGILKSVTNTGSDADLLIKFSTPLSVISNQPAFASDSMSLRRVVSGQQVQRWEIEANLSPSNDSADFLVHSVDKGYSGIVHIRMPQVFRPASQKTPVVALTASAAAVGATTINATGFGTGQNMAKGEFISFGSSPKVYLVTISGTEGSGVGIYPPLVSAVTGGTTINIGDRVTMYARYDTNTQLGIRYSDGIMSDPGSVKFIEAL